MAVFCIEKCHYDIKNSLPLKFWHLIVRFFEPVYRLKGIVVNTNYRIIHQPKIR